MVYQESPDLGPGPTRLQSLTQILLERITQHLEAEAQLNGGTLTLRQLRWAIEHFKTRTDNDVIDFYRSGWDECLAVIDEVRRESTRRMPFERLMVQPFQHLLAPQGGTADKGRVLSRRILPGYFSALQQMLGPVLFEQYQTRSRELVRIIQVARGTDFDWQDVYTDPTSGVIINDVLVHISRHFTDLPQRRAWIIEVVNAGMPLADDERERHWTFGEREFRLLMEALFGPLRERLSTPEGAQATRDRYGTVACETLADLFDELDNAVKVTPIRRTGP